MRLGMSAVQMGIENRRQAAIDEQNAWRFENEKADRTRKDTENAQLDEVYSGLQAKPEQYTMPAATFGPTDAQVDPYALGQGAQQGVGSVADAPAGFGTGGQAMAIKARPAAQGRDLYQGLMKAAMIRRDDKAIGDYQGRLDTYDKGDIISAAGKMGKPELEAWANGLNGVGRSSLPVYYAGPTGKDGYQRILLKKPDGSATTLDLNDAQLRQLYVADQLGQDPRFAAEALTMAAGVHKDIDALVTQYNSNTKGAVDTNNSAAQYANSDRYKASTLALQLSEAGARKQALDRAALQVVGQDGKGNMVAIDTRSANPRQILIPAPEGFKPNPRVFGSDPAEKMRMEAFYKAMEGIPLPKDGQANAAYLNQMSALAARYSIPPEAVGLQSVGDAWPEAAPAEKAPAKKTQAIKTSEGGSNVALADLILGKGRKEQVRDPELLGWRRLDPPGVEDPVWVNPQTGERKLSSRF